MLDLQPVLPQLVLLLQALEPVLVGLGDASRIDFVAIRWPDAVMQSELGIAAGSSTITEMRRSGAEQPRSEQR